MYCETIYHCDYSQPRSLYYYARMYYLQHLMNVPGMNLDLFELIFEYIWELIVSQKKEKIHNIFNNCTMIYSDFNIQRSFGYKKWRLYPKAIVCQIFQQNELTLVSQEKRFGYEGLVTYNLELWLHEQWHKIMEYASEHSINIIQIYDFSLVIENTRFCGLPIMQCALTVIESCIDANRKFLTRNLDLEVFESSRPFPVLELN